MAFFAVECEAIVSQENEPTTESSERESRDLNVISADDVSDESNSVESNSVAFNLALNQSDLDDTLQRRIKQLESALKQCQTYINELKSLLSDQELLESQLASTEEYAHIQQKAIAALREQLLHQQSHEKEVEILRDQRLL